MTMILSNPGLSLGDLLQWGKEKLEFLEGAEAAVNAERLLGQVAGLDRSQLYLEINRKISGDLKAKYEELVAQREKGVPLAYLSGKAFFWNEELSVNPDCLIPRPETELLIEQFIARTGFGKDRPFSFLDLGTGSGAIGIALLRYFVEARAVISDVSPKALGVAAENLKKYDLAGRTEMICSDVFENLKGRKWDAIVSNPPYLSEGDWQSVQPELFFEPKTALDGGSDGLDFYRRIIPEAKLYLEAGGWLALEMGKGQAQTIERWFRDEGFKNTGCFKDHNGIERVIMGQI